MCTPNIKIKKFIPCRNCPNRNPINEGLPLGYYYADTNYKIVKECECHKKWKKEVELTTTMMESNIVPDYTFDNYRGTKSVADLECLKKVAESPEKFLYKKMIYIYGPNGCQKSSMAQALGKELILKGYKVQYILMDNLMTNLISSFSDTDKMKEDKEYKINKCMDCDFLIIDEAFDLKKSTIFASGYQIPYLDNFIRNRFEINKKSIIFISNVLPRDIASIPPSRPKETPREGFGQSLQSLVERNVRESTLMFNDVWTENVNVIDRLGLFK